MCATAYPTLAPRTAAIRRGMLQRTMTMGMLETAETMPSVQMHQGRASALEEAKKERHEVRERERCLAASLAERGPRS